MNRQITRVSLVSLALLAALVVATTYHQTWAVASYEDEQDNAIQRVAQFTIKRGKIYAGRTVVATNRAKRVEGKTFYFRRYPTRGLVSDVVGYSTQARSRTGLERSLNDYLTASNASFGTVVDKTLDKLTGRTVQGNDVYLTIRPGAQRVAEAALGSNCGGAVALDPKTGAVLVLATSPRYDPNLVESDFPAIERRAAGANCRPASPLLNRATNGLYAPGSTFKIVTAAAALDSGRATINSTFQDPGYCTEYGKRVSNYETNQPFGRVTFKEALQHSINSVFCNLGKELGSRALVAKAKEFGFYERPPIETPADERAPSGLYDFKRHVPFVPKADNEVDPGRFAFGQERLLASPLQMAMVAAAVANGGLLMRPHLVARIETPGGRIVKRVQPREWRRAMKPSSAAALKEMMEVVVSDGTGRGAQIDGVRVAGKTGTAETGVSHRNTTAFIAFAPVGDPQVAVAVMLENQSGVGGTTAAPMAKRILQALLPAAANT